ncbi:MAG: hypothetical protein Tsb0034_26790 [Ekhidna sp.]
MIPAHNKQFLLTKEPLSDPFFDDWKKIDIGGYRLYAQRNLKVSEVQHEGVSLIALGNIYDYRYPELSIAQIAKRIAQGRDLGKIIEEYSESCGESVLIIELNNQLYLLNDACAQMEVYYTTDFQVFGSQPKLIEKVATLDLDRSPRALKHYSSHAFKKKKTLVFNKTPFKNLLHLTPNHCLDISKKMVFRFHPTKHLENHSLQIVAEKVEAILAGYLKSMVNRGEIVLPITGGIDSRTILVCALKHLSTEELKRVRYFIIELPWMKDDHPDLHIAKQIAERLNLDLEIRKLDKGSKPTNDLVFDESLTLHDSAFNPIANHAFGHYGSKDTTVVDGSIIGVVKNFYGQLLAPNARDIARITGYPKSAYAINAIRSWLKQSKKLFDSLGYHLLDMLFWEERAGNWAARSKSKFLMVCNHVSIFNSRRLFDTMLNTKRKYRDAQMHKIFDSILANAELPIHDIPINPTPKKKLIILAKKTGLYPLYRNLAIKSGLLKF